jgi:hypothetical protein
MIEDAVLCPSSRCEEGATLLGVVQSDGRVGFASRRYEVTQEFVQIARAGRAPEKRFRFASTCAMKGCRQWTGERCGVIDTIMSDRACRAPTPAGATRRRYRNARFARSAGGSGSREGRRAPRVPR